VEWEISGLKKSGPAAVVFIGHLRTPPKDCLLEIGKAALDGVRTLHETDVKQNRERKEEFEKVGRLIRVEQPQTLAYGGLRELPSRRDATLRTATANSSAAQNLRLRSRA
jgi:hypothetical protein